MSRSPPMRGRDNFWAASASRQYWQVAPGIDEIKDWHRQKAKLFSGRLLNYPV